MKKMTLNLAIVLALAIIALPGCDFTSTQLTGILQSLAAVEVNAAFGQISEKGNPKGDKNLQALIDVGKTTVQTVINNRISNQIPADPK
jgi:hypothetical protein